MKTLKLLVALIIAYIAIVPPAQLLWNTHIFESVQIFNYNKSHEWRYSNGEIDTYPGCAYLFPSESGANIAYCLNQTESQATSDLSAVPLDVPLNIQKSFLSELLHIPDTPLEQNICFKAVNFFQGVPADKFNAQTKMYLYPKQVKDLKEIDPKKLIVVTFDTSTCIQAMSGMTLVGIGNGTATVFDKSYFNGIAASAKFTLPMLTQSGGQMLAGKKKVEQRLIQDKNGSKFIEATVPLDSYEFFIQTHLGIFSETPLEEKIILIIAVYSVWWLAIKSLIDNGILLMQGLWKSVIDGVNELVHWLSKLAVLIKFAFIKLRKKLFQIFQRFRRRE